MHLVEAIYGENSQNIERLEMALSQWQSTAEGAVASAALEVKLASWRLLHFFDRSFAKANLTWHGMSSSGGNTESDELVNELQSALHVVPRYACAKSHSLLALQAMLPCSHWGCG